MKSMKQRVLLYALIFLFSGLSACGGGGGGSASNLPEVGPETQKGVIRGTVVASSSTLLKMGKSGSKESSRRGSAGQASGVSGAVCKVELTDLGSTTDENGLFRIIGVPAGLHILICDKTGSDGKTYRVLREVDVEDENPADLNNLEVKEAGYIQGKVTLEGQSDHAGIAAYVPGTTLEASTDANGMFLIRNVPEGLFEVRFEKAGYSTAVETGVPVESGETTLVNAVVLSLDTGPTGTLSIEDGRITSLSRTVFITVTASSSATLMQLSERSDFLNAPWRPLSGEASWTFDSDGEKRLYIRFANANGLASAPVSDSIIVDTVAPAVLSRSPEEDATGVSINSLISATFSEALDPSTVHTGTFMLTTDGNAVNGTVTLSGTTVSWIPSSPLAASTSYTATLTAGIRDVAGNPMAAPLSWTFTAGSLASAVLPAAPSGLEATPGSEQVTLAWSANPADENVIFYTVYGAASSWTTWSEGLPGAIKQGSVSCCTFTSTGLSNGTTYWFSVTASNNSGESVSSSPVSATPQAPPNPSGWVARQSMPTPRANHAVGVINGTLYAIGGCCVHLPTVEAYNPISNSWTTKSPMPTARGNFGIGVIDGILYAVGGRTSTQNKIATVEAYDPVTDTWTTKTPMPTARLHLAVGVVNGLLYAVGGEDGIGTGQPLATVEVYNPVTDSWTTKTPLPVPRFGHTVQVIDGVLYSVGGYIGGTTNLTTVDAYDPATDTWSAKAPMATARKYLSSGVVNGKLYALGGTTGGTAYTTVEKYDPISNTWTTEAPMPTGRYTFAAGVADGILYVVGGMSPPTFLATVEAFTP